MFSSFWCGFSAYHLKIIPIGCSHILIQYRYEKILETIFILSVDCLFNFSEMHVKCRPIDYSRKFELSKLGSSYCVPINL